MPKVINIEPTPQPGRPEVRAPEADPEARGALLPGFRLRRGGSPGLGPVRPGPRHLRVLHGPLRHRETRSPRPPGTDLIDPVCEGHRGQPGGRGGPRGAQPGHLEGDDAKLARINELLDSRIRPGLAGDGGGLEVISFDGTTLEISYHGACGSCPSAHGRHPAVHRAPAAGGGGSRHPRDQFLVVDSPMVERQSDIAAFQEPGMNKAHTGTNGTARIILIRSRATT